MKRGLLILPLVAAVLGGCTLPFGKNNVVEQVTQKAEEKAAEQAVLANCTYDKDVCKYFASMISAYSRPLVMKTTTVMREYGTSTSIVKMDGKGNMDTVSMKGGKEESAMVIVDNITYFKDLKDNTWYKLADNKESESSSLLNPTEMISEFKKTAEDSANKMVVKKLGQEACGTLTCEKYQMDEPELKTTMIVWFDTKEYKARKMETSIEDGAKTTIEYSYESVTITTPSPVKEMPDYSTMMEQNGVKMPSAEELQKMMQEVPQSDSGDE